MSERRGESSARPIFDPLKDSDSDRCLSFQRVTGIERAQPKRIAGGRKLDIRS